MNNTSNTDLLLEELKAETPTPVKSIEDLINESLVPQAA